MTQETLLELLGAAAESRKGTTFSFSERQDAAVMVAAEGTLLTVTRVASLTVTGAHALIDGEREQLYVDAAAIVAVRLKAGPSGSGFLKA